MGVVFRICARTRLDYGVSEDWMPAVAGGFFLPAFLLGIYMLSQLPPPTAAERAQRTERPAMSRQCLGQLLSPPQVQSSAAPVRYIAS